MRTAVIQATSQTAKNEILFKTVAEEKGTGEVVNFGCFPHEDAEYSYIDIAIEAGLLLASGAVDFVVTGCSSGQGMMLAMNNLPGVVCGYVPMPQDAFLFSRINAGNAVSVPLGLNFGWAGEINLTYIMKALFSGTPGEGYPAGDAPRKRRDTQRLKRMGSLSRVTMAEFLGKLDAELLGHAIERKNVVDFVLEHGNNGEITDWLRRASGFGRK